MIDRIIGKLDIFLKNYSMTKQHEVVYLMVELRKLLDRNTKSGSEQFSLIRFHADWVVHTRKDKITPSIKKIMTEVEKNIDPYPKDGNIKFLFLPEFRDELIRCLRSNNLPVDFCQNDNRWFSFTIALTQVLADQPIINPSDNIAEFRYVDVENKGIMATIKFRNKKEGASITLGFSY